MSPRASDPIPRRVSARLKGWLVWDGEFLMGPRYARLLEGIDETGTIRGACDRTGLSYRTCLARLRAMERTLGAPILITRRGGEGHGSAELTPLGVRLVHVYHAWRSEIQRASDRAFAKVVDR
jgi:molybdate transport system regulatory protein